MYFHPRPHKNVVIVIKTPFWALKPKIEKFSQKRLKYFWASSAHKLDLLITRRMFVPKFQSILEVGTGVNSIIPGRGVNIPLMLRKFASTQLVNNACIFHRVNLNKKLYLHIRVWCTVGLSWNTWLLTARLCSSLNGGKMIPSLTGNVSLNSSSSVKRKLTFSTRSYCK